MNEVTQALAKRLIEKQNPPKESQEGKELHLKDAKVISIKDKSDFRWSALGVLVEDAELGKVWFKTGAKFVWDLQRGDLLTAVVICSGEGDGILFGRKPKDAKVNGQTKAACVCPNCGTQLAE